MCSHKCPTCGGCLQNKDRFTLKPFWYCDFCRKHFIITNGVISEARKIVSQTAKNK